MNINYNTQFSDSSDSDSIQDNPIIHKDIDENLRTENYAEENKGAPYSSKTHSIEIEFQENNEELKNIEEKESSESDTSNHRDSIIDWKRIEHSKETFEQIKEEKIEEKQEEAARIKKRKIIKSDREKRDIQAQQIEDETKKKDEVSLENKNREIEKIELHPANNPNTPIDIIIHTKRPA